MKQPKADLYGVLGLRKGASESEIKGAYRKMAKKYHPDMHASKGEEEKKRMQEKFTEVSEANEVLTDPKKKELYDKYGSVFPPGVDPEKMGGFGARGPEGFTYSANMGDFSDLFGGGGGGHGIFGDFASAFGSGGFRGFSKGGSKSSFTQPFFDAHDGGFSSRQRAPGAPNAVTQYPLKCTLEEIYSGITKKLKIKKSLRAGGTQETVIDVEVKPGYKKGTKFTFQGLGDELPDGRGTDIQVVLEEKPHDRFTRVDSNLTCEIEIGIKEALKGFRRSFKGIDGKTVIQVTEKDIKQLGRDEVIPGQGMPDRARHGKRGDLIVKTKIILDLTSREKEALRKAL